MNELSPQHREFVTCYLETGNAAESVKRAGFNTKLPAQYGYGLLQQERIRREIHRQEAMEREAMKRKFQAGSQKAFEVLMSIMQDTEGNPQHRVAAAKDILSRAGFDATAKHDSIEEVTEHETIESLRTKLLAAFNEGHERAGTSAIDTAANTE